VHFATCIGNAATQFAEEQLAIATALTLGDVALHVVYLR